MEETKQAAVVPYPEEAEPIQQDVLDVVEAMSLGKDERSYAEATLDKANEIAKKYGETLEKIEAVRLENSEEVKTLSSSVSEMLAVFKEKFKVLEDMRDKYVRGVNDANANVASAEKAVKTLLEEIEYLHDRVDSVKFWLSFCAFAATLAIIAVAFSR